MSGTLTGSYGHIKQGENYGGISDWTIMLRLTEKYGTIIGEGWANLDNDEDDILIEGEADGVFMDEDYRHEEPIIIEKIQDTDTERIITFKTDLNRKAPNGS